MRLFSYGFLAGWWACIIIARFVDPPLVKWLTKKQFWIWRKAPRGTPRGR